MWLIHFGWFYFGKIWKNSCFSGGLRLDWGNIAQAVTAGLGSERLDDKTGVIPGFRKFQMIIS